MSNIPGHCAESIVVSSFDALPGDLAKIGEKASAAFEQVKDIEGAQVTIAVCVLNPEANQS